MLDTIFVPKRMTVQEQERWFTFLSSFNDQTTLVVIISPILQIRKLRLQEVV